MSSLGSKLRLSGLSDIRAIVEARRITLMWFIGVHRDRLLLGARI